MCQLSYDKCFLHFTLQLPVKGKFPENVYQNHSPVADRHLAGDRIL